MRQIRFRGIGQISKEMVFGDLIHGVGHKKGNVYILPNEHNLAYVKNCDPLDGVRVIPETVGQLTGLKDKHGNEIFEGDIAWINEAQRDYVVKYHNGCFKLFHLDPRLNDMLWGTIERVSELLWTIEIIGNRFEHPELIYNSKNSIHSPKP